MDTDPVIEIILSDGNKIEVKNWETLSSEVTIMAIRVTLSNTIYLLEGLNRYFFQKIGVISLEQSTADFGFQVGGEDFQKTVWVLEVSKNGVGLKTTPVEQFSYRKDLWKQGLKGVCSINFWSSVS